MTWLLFLRAIGVSVCVLSVWSPWGSGLSALSRGPQSPSGPGSNGHSVDHSISCLCPGLSGNTAKLCNKKGNAADTPFCSGVFMSPCVCLLFSFVLLTLSMTQCLDMTWPCLCSHVCVGLCIYVLRPSLSL